MEYIEYLIDELVSTLTRKKEFYTETLRNSPEGSIIHENNGGRERYLQSIPQGKDANGSYRYKRVSISHDPEIILGLAKKEYAASALRLIDHNIMLLNSVLSGFRDLSPNEILSSTKHVENILLSAKKISRDTGKWKGYLHNRPLTVGHGPCARPLLLSDILDHGKATDHLQQWANEDYDQSSYMPEKKIHTTSRGLRVRSRAELLIAEKLYRYEIPFRYEQNLQIGKNTVSPDFSFLDYNRDEFYWEHCGMMRDSDYLDLFLWKRKLYEGAGLSQWTDMIYSFDMDGNVDMRQIDAIIKLWVLPRIARHDAT